MLSAFTWGYWGWGTATKQLVQMIDAAERENGFEPPLFADIRISRGVRAPGFNGSAFEHLLGPGRYRWMRDLGNLNIIDKENATARARIFRPAAAADLLNEVINASKANRRVIFYCSCPRPAHCHRTPVPQLLVKAAKKHGTSLTVTEWPGGNRSG